MADYGTMSDADLMALVQPKTAPPSDFSKMSDADLMAHIGKAPVSAEGLYKAADSGVAKGAAGLLGSVGDLTNLGAKGIEKASDWINDKLGLQKYERPAEPGPVASFLNKNIPTSESMGREIQNRYYGGEKPYEPQNTAERYVNRMGEMAPGMVAGPGGLVSKGIAAVGAGAGSVAGEDLASHNIGKDAAPYGSVVGAMVGGLSPGAIARALTPLPASPARTRLVGILNDEGVTSLTAGQKTGNKPLQYAESFLGDGPLAGQGASRIQQEGQQQFTEAAMRRAGAGPDASPEVLQQNYRRLGNQFEELSMRNTLVPDNQFITELTAAVRDYRNVPHSQQRAMVQGYIDDIIRHVNAGQMSGAQYQEMRSRLSRQASSLRGNDPTLSGALRDMRNALDNAMERSIPPGSADAGLWRQSRREYGANEVLQNSASKAGEAMTEGQISPAALRNTVSAENRGAYARGEGPFSELARAGAGVMVPLPNSGTAQRGIWSNLAQIPITATLGRAVTNPIVQQYLANQIVAGGRREGLPTGAQALARALLSQDRAPLLNGPSR